MAQPWDGFTNAAYDQNHGAGAWGRNISQLSAFENGAGFQADGTYGTGVGRMSDAEMEAGRRAQTYGGVTTGAGYGQQPTTPDGYNPATSPGGYGGMPPGMQQSPGGTVGMTKPMQLPGGQTDYSNLGTTGGNMAGGYSGGYGGPGLGSNPYLSQMADEIGRRSQQGLGQAYSQIRSNAVGAGGLGGSRQGVAEGVATGQANDALTGNLAALYSGQYNQDANRWLQQYGMDQNYDINSQNARNQFNTAQRGLDITSVGMGADILSKGMQGPWNTIQSANSVYSPYANGGNGSTSQGDSGSNWQSILAGLGGGAQFGKNMGWW